MMWEKNNNPWFALRENDRPQHRTKWNTRPKWIKKPETRPPWHGETGRLPFHQRFDVSKKMPQPDFAIDKLNKTHFLEPGKAMARAGRRYAEQASMNKLRGKKVEAISWVGQRQKFENSIEKWAEKFSVDKKEAKEKFKDHPKFKFFDKMQAKQDVIMEGKRERFKQYKHKKNKKK